MVDALTRIHAALVPGGVLVDTTPISLRLPVALDGEPVGELEDDAWLETVAAVDAEIERAVAAAGVIAHRRFDGMWHDFHLQAGVLAEADEAISELGARLRAHVQGRVATK